jgi:hypothetical protein
MLFASNLAFQDFSEHNVTVHRIGHDLRHDRVQELNKGVIHRVAILEWSERKGELYE